MERLSPIAYNYWRRTGEQYKVIGYEKDDAEIIIATYIEEEARWVIHTKPWSILFPPTPKELADIVPSPSELRRLK